MLFLFHQMVTSGDAIGFSRGDFMTREKFIKFLQEKKIPSNLVCFDELHGKDDVYYIRNNYGRWEVSYIERGNEFSFKQFKSESDALSYLENKLSGYISIYSGNQ